MKYGVYCGCLLPFLFASVAGAQIQEHALQLEVAEQQSALPTPRVSHAAVGAGDRLVVLGGYYVEDQQTVVLRDVLSARTNAEGELGEWRNAGKLTAPRSGHSAVMIGDRLFVVGGSTANWSYLGLVESARMRSDGTVDKWIVSKQELNIPRNSAGLAVHRMSSGDTFLYAVGGVGQVGSDTVHFGSVEFAKVREDGTVGPWRLASFRFKGGRSAPGVLIAGGRLWVVGGWGDMSIDDVFEDAQSAEIRPDGSLAPWVTHPEPRVPSYGHGLVFVEQAGRSFLVALGGNAGEGNVLDMIQYAELRQDGTLSRWRLARSRLLGERWGHACIALGSTVFVVGGSSRANYHGDVQAIRAKE